MYIVMPSCSTKIKLVVSHADTIVPITSFSPFRCSSKEVFLVRENIHDCDSTSVTAELVYGGL